MKSAKQAIENMEYVRRLLLEQSSQDSPRHLNSPFRRPRQTWRYRWTID